MIWMSQSTTTLYLIPQPQDISAALISPAFNADQGITFRRITPTTVALTAIGLLPDTTNQPVQSKSVGYAERKDILSPTAPLTMTRMTITSLKTRDMLETELVTQGNEGGNITVFLSFLSFLYGLVCFSFHLWTQYHMDTHVTLYDSSYL